MKNTTKDKKTTSTPTQSKPSTSQSKPTSSPSQKKPATVSNLFVVSDDDEDDVLAVVTDTDKDTKDQ